MIIPEKKRIFVHIPKTGGSSMAMALAEDSKIKVGGKTVSSIQNKGKYKVNDWQKHMGAPDMLKYDVVSEEIFNEYYKFAIVRNPWDKILSEYYWANKVNALKNQDFKSFLKSFLKQKESIDNDDRHPTKIMPNYPSLMHRKTQKSFVSIDNELILNEVFRFEEFNKIFEYIGLPNKKVNQSKNSKSVDRVNPFDEDSEAYDMVTEAYQDDIDFFGFEYKKPATKNVKVL